MKNYSFLLKPLFFIACLLFSTWLVIKIEKISPSDFGEPEPPVKVEVFSPEQIQFYRRYLHHLCEKYNAGKIEKEELNEKLLFFLETLKEASDKEK